MNATKQNIEVLLRGVGGRCTTANGRTEEANTSGRAQLRCGTKRGGLKQMGNAQHTPLSMILDLEIKAAKKQTRTYTSRERRCRQIMTTLLPGTTFTKCRPQWNLNPDTGRALELDMYEACVKIGKWIGGLAIECDGVQHSRFHPLFHANQAEYDGQVRRDFFTTRNFKDHRVYLIRVPSRERLCDSRLCVFLSDALGKIPR